MFDVFGGIEHRKKSGEDRVESNDDEGRRNTNKRFSDALYLASFPITAAKRF